MTTRSAVPFCGVPTARLGQVPQNAVAAVLGAGYALGSPHDGAENGPYFLRTVSKTYTWAAAVPRIVDLRTGGSALGGVVDMGDLVFDGMSLERAQRTVRLAVASLPPRTMPAVIGGDHTVTLPVVEVLAARRSAPFTVVQFDHHLDLQIWDAAPARPDATREPVFHTNVMSHVSDRVGPGRLVQVGVAPWATVEAEAADDVAGFLAGIGRRACLFSSDLEDPTRFRSLVGAGADVYLTVDVDVLDETVMSSTSYPARVGIGVRELFHLIDEILSRNRLIGFDVVEFAADRTARDATTLADAERATMVFLHLMAWACRQAGEDCRD